MPAFSLELVMIRTYMRELNAQQRKAVKHSVSGDKAKPQQPLLILAGAGTGKTKTLTSCAVHLLVNGANPSEMMICSFTRRASQQLTQKIGLAYRSATGSTPSVLPFAGTFHSVAAGLLREFAVDLRLSQKFTILGQSEAQDLIELVRTRRGYISDKKLFPSKAACLALFSYSKNACVSLSDALETRFTQMKKWKKQLRRLSKEYETAKKEQRCLDYDDLLGRFALACKHPTVGPVLQRRFKFILVDEYQDTNRLQLKIIQRLKPDGTGVIVVGDDAQAIYSFRAASVSNIREFSNSFTCPARVVTLEENYRSTQPILDASNALLAESKDAFKKTLFSRRLANKRPRIVFVEDEASQAQHVVRLVNRARERGARLSDQAILFRASNHSAQLELALTSAGISFQKWGGIKFLEAAHIRDILAVLRWVENPRDQVAGFRALNLVRGIGKATAAIMLENRAPGKLAASLIAIEPPKAAQKDWMKIVDCARRAAKLSWPMDLDAIVQWYKPILKREYDDSEGRCQDIDQLLAVAAGCSTRSDFLTQLALDPPDQIGSWVAAKPSDDDVLTLSTIHSAKGHEWRNVTILSAVDGCIPSSRTLGDIGLEEERRLLYVAMTRAKKSLKVFVPRRIVGYRQNARVVDFFSRPSTFLSKGVLGKFAKLDLTNSPIRKTA